MMWDIEEFYDALMWKLLLESGLEHGFPPSILALEMMLHMGGTLPSVHGYYSDGYYEMCTVQHFGQSGTRYPSRGD
eukprot:6120331-Pyramimonas_sp.AAC.1